MADDDRCSPENPCDEKSEFHILLWGECWVLRPIEGSEEAAGV